MPYIITLVNQALFQAYKVNSFDNLQYFTFNTLFIFFPHLIFFGGREKKRKDNNIVVHKMAYCDTLFFIQCLTRINKIHYELKKYKKKKFYVSFL